MLNFTLSLNSSSCVYPSVWPPVNLTPNYSKWEKCIIDHQIVIGDNWVTLTKAQDYSKTEMPVKAVYETLRTPALAYDIDRVCSVKTLTYHRYIFVVWPATDSI